MFSPDILSDEGTEDEGIGRNVRKYHGKLLIESTKSIMIIIYTVEGTQAEGKKETVSVDQVVKFSYIPCHLWYDVF